MILLIVPRAYPKTPVVKNIARIEKTFSTVVRGTLINIVTIVATAQ